MATGGRLAVALVAGGLLAAACGSDGEESLAPLDPEPTTSEVEVSEADASETSVPSEDTTSSTELPEVTTPVDASGKPLIEIPTEWDSDLDEIFGRYQLYYDAFYIAAGPPSADVSYPPLRELVERDAFFEDLVETFGLYERDQSFIRIEDDSLTQHVLRLPNPAPLEKVEGNEVVIQDCYVMDFSFETSEGEVKYTGYESVLRNVKMKVIDGEWRVFASRDADEGSDGQAECAGLIDELAS